MGPQHSAENKTPFASSPLPFPGRGFEQMCALIDFCQDPSPTSASALNHFLVPLHHKPHDHTFYRKGVRTMLMRVPDMEIIGEARTGDETISLATRLQPDVVLMDIKMPGTNGIEATRALVQAQPQIRMLMVTMFEDDGFVFAAMRSGARGYVLKDANQEELVQAVRAVHRGEVIFSPAIAQRMIHYFAVLPATVSQLAFPTLTDRERDILQLMTQGESNTAIATRFSLSLKTIQNHVSSIFSKLQVADRAKAIIQARDAGLGYS